MLIDTRFRRRTELFSVSRRLRGQLRPCIAPFASRHLRFLLDTPARQHCPYLAENKRPVYMLLDTDLAPIVTKPAIPATRHSPLATFPQKTDNRSPSLQRYLVANPIETGNLNGE